MGISSHGNRLDADRPPPAIDHVNVSYIEFSGWVPGGTQMLAAREVRVDGHFKRSFELIDLAILNTLKHAEKPEA